MEKNGRTVGILTQLSHFNVTEALTQYARNRVDLLCDAYLPTHIAEVVKALFAYAFDPSSQSETEGCATVIEEHSPINVPPSPIDYQDPEKVSRSFGRTLYRPRLGCVNLEDHHKGPSLNDRSETLENSQIISQGRSTSSLSNDDVQFFETSPSLMPVAEKIEIEILPSNASPKKASPKKPEPKPPWKRNF